IHLHLIVIGCAVLIKTVQAQTITAAGQPAQLDIRSAAANSIRITLKPVSYANDVPFTPAVAERTYPKPVISLRTINKPVKSKVGTLQVEVKPDPLTVIVTNAKGQRIQELG